MVAETGSTDRLSRLRHYRDRTLRKARRSTERRFAAGRRIAGAASTAEPTATSPRTFVAGLVLVVLSLASGLATYFILTGLTPILPTHDVVVGVLLVNGLLILAMVAMVGWHVWGLWRARQRQDAASGLHIRIVSLFSIVALLPAVVLAVFASVSLDRGLDEWFSTRTKLIIRDSVDVANAYLDEHARIIRSDVMNVARELDESAQLMREKPDAFNQLFAAQLGARRIPLAYLINGRGNPLVVAGASAGQVYRAPPVEVYAIADQGLPVDVGLNSPGGVGAVKKLTGAEDTYLYLLRPADQKVVQHLRRTQANVAEYGALEQRRAGVQVAFGLMYLTIALTLLLAAIWVGLWFANRLVAPIRRLIGAAQQVSTGNFDVKVAVEPGRNDVGQLGDTFNLMTAELATQRKELTDAGAQIDERRRLMEAVLAGVSAGVIGVDEAGAITLVNASAAELLGAAEEALIGRPLAEALPEFAALVAETSPRGRAAAQGQILMVRGGSERTLSVRVTRERAGRKDYGLVVTFDDISELVSAQRTSAWADVARRIAHEIKNPLTPIQLSAERIRRKYGDAITGDREVFDRCTDTIIRHVGDIGRMVDEFSSFARMPAAVFEAGDISETVKEAALLFQMARPDIDYTVSVPEMPLVSDYDRRLISQAVTNLVKNAGEGIAALAEADPPIADRGRISVVVVRDAAGFTITVTDNGVGLPKENRARLVEPYVTTRAKGTGLGLAIVQRITEQHGGRLELTDAADESGAASRGARVMLHLPILSAGQANAAAATMSTPASHDTPAATGGSRADFDPDQVPASTEPRRLTA